MSRCCLSIWPSIPRITMLSRLGGQGANREVSSTLTIGRAPTGRSVIRRLFARHEDLAVDAEAALGGFEDLNKKSLRRVGRLLHRAEHHVGNSLYHGAALLEREHARGDMQFHQRRAKTCRRKGVRQP